MVDYFEAKSGAGWHDATLHVSKSGGNINFTVAVSNVGSWSYEGRYTARLEKMQDGRLVTIATKNGTCAPRSNGSFTNVGGSGTSMRVSVTMEHGGFGSVQFTR
ncbi:hypothetical protein CON66_28145 [Bacillus cereus]|uniref:Uncharacterized protein n=1 Tax=Bacillus thuringiensis subsp. medellin TaxID=79672 RepID=A0A9X6R8Z6_BACTV|nr:MULTISPECIES: hypothetical protein [Bacillus cereus group]WIK98911.1 hypothetical protein QPL86_30285 [Bacillus bombysepticus]MDZ4441676.1 hypothetical protein [Bacillus cereus]OUB84301.1 hypothetical protein BK784_35790 [Bacillus thuringiensis serovar medellin]PEA92726.1 hypothetical protein CON66_28145 [Bacillus cereus]PED34230.1 hypothetical protein CON24_31660 [Bacillus cereus]